MSETRRLTLAEAGTRAFDSIIPGERFRLSMPGLSLSEADRLQWHRGELIGQLTVWLDLPGIPSWTASRSRPA